MKRTTRGITIIDTLSALLLLAAVALYAWPITARVTTAAPVTSAVLPTKTDVSLASGDDVSAITAANILSPVRKAPTTRYVSPDRAGPSDFAMPAAFVPARDSTATENAIDGDAVPSLYGIVTGEGTSRALLRLSDGDVNPVLLREGDVRGAYRVISIRSNAVIVAGPSGKRTLRLSRSARGDSTGKQL
ncbi:MAG: hypothetical protein ABI852_04710 [Gemmatimonadaceae bacterium]